MKATTKPSPETQGESRKFLFFRVPTFRKHRMSPTRMGAWKTDPPNHGTRPDPSFTRYILRSLLPMATATAVPSTANRHASTKPTSTVPSGEATAPVSPIINFAPIPVSVERDEAWVQQLQAEQNQRFQIQAQVMYEEYLANLSSAGPFASGETRAELLRRYEERLGQMKQMQQEELDLHIEMELQERLWSLGQQDSSWDGWDNVVAEQASILAQIQRARYGGGGAGDQSSVRERIWENQREAEDLQRRNEEWQKTEPQRVRDRQRWAEKTRLTNFNLGERRQRDLADAEAHVAEEHARERKSERLTQEARQGAAELRGRSSRAALNVQAEMLSPGLTSFSETSTVDESIFTSSVTSDTAPSSFTNTNERWRPSAAPPNAGDPRGVPSSGPASGDSAPYPATSFPGSSPSARGGASNTTPHSASPLSSTPTSKTMTHAKIDDLSGTERWIPPETAREPARKGPMPYDGSREAPARKPSMLFGASPGPAPSPTLEEPSRRSQAQQPRPNAPPQMHAPTPQSPQTQPAPSSQPPLRAPNAPGLRPQPLPQTQPPRQQPQSASEPTTRQSTPSSQPPPSASFSSSFTDSKQKKDDSGRRFSTSYSPTQPNSGSRAAPSPVNTGFKGSPDAARPSPPPKTPPMSSRPDEHRTKLRNEYVAQETQRSEAERRRREEEANERRAEDARRRGAEKRRQEEMAREAERREAERKARKASIPNMRPVTDRPVLEVWNAYENQWAAMASASQLRFRSIPWPVLSPVSSPEMLLPIHIAAFILHPQHSPGKARKDRLRDALLRWHPDRFETKWLKKVVEEERDSVQEGVGLVVRALNDLMSTEGTFGA